jgi:hypothetical protein
MCLHIINILKDLIDTSDMGEGSDGRNLSLYQKQLQHWVLHALKLKKDLTRLHGANKKKRTGFGTEKEEKHAIYVNGKRDGYKYVFDTEQKCENRRWSSGSSQRSDCRVEDGEETHDRWVTDKVYTYDTEQSCHADYRTNDGTSNVYNVTPCQREPFHVKKQKWVLDEWDP